MTEFHEPISLDPELCRKRQQRLLTVMEHLKLDRAILAQREHVQYLTGFRPGGMLHAAVSLDSDGHCLLVSPNTVPERAVADQIVPFEAQWHCTLRQDQRSAIAEVFSKEWSKRKIASRVGCEFSDSGRHFSETLPATDWVDFEPELWTLRRNKDVDELAMIRRAVACTEAMYARAREVIVPGISEIEVYNQLQAAAVEVAGEPLTGFGNDFQCNSSGGPPRPRHAQGGELFVLDLGPGYRGYYADNCRTMLVGDAGASEEQMRAWKGIVDVLEMVEQTVQPGVNARELFQQAQEMLDEYRPYEFFHHLGHGIGLFPHEGPHLNPHWDDCFQEGDVFTAEPGLYGPELRAGIRLEQNYLVTATGVERLTSFPLDL